jgi:hypothetical protein
MPEFLRIRKKKFNTLKNLYDENRLKYSVFQQNILSIIDEIKKKLKQFIDTKEMINGFLKSDFKSLKSGKSHNDFKKSTKPKVSLRPAEKKQATEFLNEILTELENDSNRSNYKNELEEFLNELLNEITAKQIEPTKDIERPIHFAKNESILLKKRRPLRVFLEEDPAEKKARLQKENEEKEKQETELSNQMIKKTIRVSKNKYRSYVGSDKFEELLPGEKERVIFMDDSNGYVLMIKRKMLLVNKARHIIDLINKIKIETLPQVKILYNSTVENTYNSRINVNKWVYDNLTRTTKISNKLIEQYDYILSNEFKKLTLKQQEEYIKTNLSDSYKKSINLYLNSLTTDKINDNEPEKTNNISNIQQLTFDEIKKEFDDKKIIYSSKTLIDNYKRLISILNYSYAQERESIKLELERKNKRKPLTIV